MYKFIRTISFIIRSFCLPNPFGGIKYGFIINIVIEPILQPITYGIVGLFYESRSAPALGSFLYLIFYSVHTILILLWSSFNFTRISLISIGVGYTVFMIAVLILKNGLYSRHY
jgi:hypothetical protein